MTNPIVSSVLASSVPCTPGQCPHCDKQGLLILPLRYSAFCTEDDDALGSAPTLAASGADQAPELSTAKYAIRMMREGYIYILIDRQGVQYWDSYYVRPSGRLMRFSGRAPERKGSDIPCARMASLADATMISIESPSEVASTYWLFTPDPMSPAKLQEYQDNTDEYVGRHMLQKFSPALWVSGERGTNVELPADAIAQFTLEYLAIRGLETSSVVETPLAQALAVSDTPLMRALEDQAFPPFRDPLHTISVQDILLGGNALMSAGRLRQNAPLLRNVQARLEETNGLGFVLLDQIGITQELNAWRNEAMEGIEPWMQQTDAHGNSNEWKFLSAVQYKEIRQGVRDARIQTAQTRAERSYDSQLDDLREAFDDPAIRRRFGEEWAEQTKARIEEAHRRDPLGDLQRRRERARENTERKLNEYEALLDGTQDTILAEFEREAAPWEAKMRERAPDHLAWLQSGAFKNALNTYDEADWHQGWAFAIQTGLAMTGVEASDEGQSLLDRWWHDTEIGEDNLAWRTYGLNHQQLITDLRAALAEAKAQADTPESLDVGAAIASGFGNASKVLKLFKQANSVLEACEKNGQVAWFQRNRLGVLMSWYAQFGRAVFKAAVPTGLDRAMQRMMVRALQMRLGEFAVNLQFDEIQRANPDNAGSINRARGQVQWRVRKALEAEFGKEAGGRFYQVRFLTIVTMVEAVNFVIKAGHTRADTREVAELSAAGLGLAAGSLELVGLGSTWVGEHYRAGTQIAHNSRVWGGRLRLYGGFLGGVAGLTGAVIDGFSAYSDFKDRNLALSFAYASRCMVIGAATVLGATVAFAGSASYLAYLMRSSGNRLLVSAFRVLSGWAAQLAARQSVMLLMRTWGARLGWAGVGITVLIVLLTPDAYEAWCKKSVFRLRKDKKGFENAGQELAELHLVLKEVET